MSITSDLKKPSVTDIHQSTVDRLGVVERALVDALVKRGIIRIVPDGTGSE